MQQLILLRWIAVVGQVVTICVVHWGYGIALPLVPMLLVAAALASYNALSLIYWRGHPQPPSRVALLTGLLVDVATLTAQLYLSGGIGNPFVFLFLLHVVLGAVLLPRAQSWIVVAATALCSTGLARFPGPVVLPVNPGDGLADPYIQGLLVCFVLVATLLVVFIGRISHIVRTRDAHLAALRQQAAEEEHIVRMGLLASGAAHELGTPLSTIAIILRDWQHLPSFESDPELLHDVLEMQTQVARCKSIVTGILLSAGETRGDAPEETFLHAFIDDLVAHWRDTRPVRSFSYRNNIDEDIEIIADTGLQQTLCNLLDNALEASPEWLSLEASCDADTLIIRVSDTGPGFSQAMLAQFGQPYRSSKGRPGSGLGLFLSLNVARTLGGTLSARNLAEGGAIVTMMLPPSALRLGDGTHEHQA